ncbi:MAG: DNA polymerase III subunit delta [Ruminiclostridium sp.]
MSLEILKKQIKEDKLQNVYLFYGAEDYLIKYYINTITKLIVNDENSELNYIAFDGKTDVDTIIANCETMPMFSDKKLVIIKNSGLFKSKKSDSPDSGLDKKSTKDKFSEYLENIPSYTCLILVETELDKRLKLVNAIKKHGLIVELDFQKPADLVKWVIKVFRSYNKNIEQMPASYLVENSEYSMTELLNEIEKIVNFVGDKTQINITDIESVCNKSIKSRIFDLTDAVSEGNISKAFILLNDMAALKEPMQKVLFMIIRQIRMVYRIKLLRQKGMRDDLVSKQLGLTPFVASKVMSISRNLDINVLEKAMYYSLELDEAIKTGRITDRIAIELLIASIG